MLPVNLPVKLPVNLRLVMRLVMRPVNAAGDAAGESAAGAAGEAAGGSAGVKLPGRLQVQCQTLPQTLTREPDPVVITGADVPGMEGVSAVDIVGYARQGGAWQLIPIQVDERVVVDLCEVYGKSSGRWTSSPACKTDQVLTSLVYADAQTYTGADPNALFDLDDEVVWMARDSGDRISAWSDPPSVVPRQWS